MGFCSFTQEACCRLSDPKRVDLKVKQKRAVLVAVVLPGDQRDLADPLDELRGLAKTAGVKCVAQLVQNRFAPDPRSCVGKGKLEELKLLVEGSGADTILFDNNLTPGQARVLEKELGKVIVDRSELILSIFAEHARTHEAQLQVELAQQLYMRTRLKRLWTHLERTEGATGSTGGPGEQQIEIDRRLVDTRVAELRARLKELEQRRERQVAQRRSQLTVSLVGYTNAGKSTLMRALTGADVYGPVLLSDTVGFIRDLPHRLIASFKATLEETRQADLLLHVADASSPLVDAQIAAVRGVLEELDVDEKDAILVLNKLDAIPDRGERDRILARYPHAIGISARSTAGLADLARAVSDALGSGFRDVDVETDPGNGRLLAWLGRHGEVLSRRFADDRVVIHCRVPAALLGRIPGDEAVVRDHDSPAGEPDPAPR